MTPDQFVSAVLNGESPDHAILDTFSAPEFDAVLEQLLSDPAGRRWLRIAPQLGLQWPRDKVLYRLLEHEEDFRSKRRDQSLHMLLDRVRDEDLLRHACAILAGSAASSFWGRWDGDPDAMERIATRLLASCDPAAAENILYGLVIDPLDPWALGPERRTRVAAAALASSDAEVRGIAAEYLLDAAPEELLAGFDHLVLDDSERVRGIVWSAALRLARADARDLAFTVIGDESAALAVRRSALVAAGTQLQTTELVDLLSYIVVHPNETLASDAASLLRDRHRHPDIALAAQMSPHTTIRDIAALLLDPLSGSPAAGGSRTTVNTADIYRDALRQFEERASDRDPS